MPSGVRLSHPMRKYANEPSLVKHGCIVRANELIHSSEIHSKREAQEFQFENNNNKNKNTNKRRLAWGDDRKY